MQRLATESYPEIINLIALNTPDLKTFRALQLVCTTFGVTDLVKQQVRARFIEQIVKEKTGKRLVKFERLVPSGLKHGACRTFYCTGVLAKETVFAKGIKLSKVWYHGSGSLEGSVRFLNGLKHGEQKTWTSEGALDSITRFNRGELEGLCLAWIPEKGGMIDYLKSYRKGVLDGPSYQWRPVEDPVWSRELGRLWRVGNYRKAIYNNGVYQYSAKISRLQGTSEMTALLTRNSKSDLVPSLCHQQ
jgi:antitoxin component YwqK of YwqJK toxin-antitoxin module